MKHAGIICIFIVLNLQALGQWAEYPVLTDNQQLTVAWTPGSQVEKVRLRTSNSDQPWRIISLNSATDNTYPIRGLKNFKSYELQLGTQGDQWSNSIHARPRGSEYPAGLHAGGQINAITRVADGVVLIGGDAGSFHRSIDGGETWYPSFKGIVSSPAGWKIASLAFDPVSEIIYSLAGKRNIGYFYASTDNGISWNLRARGSELSVNANTDNYPRPVGKLIAIDTVHTGHVYLGCRNGIKKTTNGGDSWGKLALEGQEIRCLILSGDYLYAAVRGTGLCRIASSGEVTVFNGTNAPTMPEELFCLDENLYVAAHSKGILRLERFASAEAKATWTDLKIGTSGYWSAIHGYKKENQHIIYVGNSHGVKELSEGRHTTLMKCINAQAPSDFNWINISSADNIIVNKQIAAGNGETYWRVDLSKTENFFPGWVEMKRLDGNVFAIDQIMVDTAKPNKVHVVGQMGLWRTLDGGKSWNPPVIGLGLATHNCAAVNYSRPGDLYVGDTDNGLWISRDHGESLEYITRPHNPGVKPVIYDIFVDSLNHSLYAAGKDNAWKYDLNQRKWESIKDHKGQSLKEHTDGKTVHGVAAGTAAGKKVIVAAVKQDGIWTLQEGKSWVKDSNGPPCDDRGVQGTPFCWPDNTTGLIYFFDRNSGLWRSKNAGLKWTKIWDKTNKARFSGSLTAIDQGTLLMATGDACYRLTGANEGPAYGEPKSQIDIKNTGIPYPGRVASYKHLVFITGRTGTSGKGEVVLRMSDDGGESFQVLSEAFYQGAAAIPCHLAVAKDYIYTVNVSMGTIVSRYDYEVLAKKHQ